MRSLKYLKKENGNSWTDFLLFLRRAHFLLPMARLFFPSYFALLAKMEMTRCCTKQFYKIDLARLI